MGASPPYVAPQFGAPRAFAHLPDAYLRDPTTALFDPETATWHLWCTLIPTAANTSAGYPGSIWHWWANGTALPTGGGAWRDGGQALAPSGDAGRFDGGGVFTPAAVRDRGRWLLFFGGVANRSREHAESVGVATAASPWGPFARYGANPVFTRYDGVAGWCGGAAARVDEVKPVQVWPAPASPASSARRFLVVKAVCANFTALPVLYSPVDAGSWAPPFVGGAGANAPSPLFRASATCERKGFEEPTLLVGPDGLLHFFGHNHGNCGAGAKYAHFVSRRRPDEVPFGGLARAAPFGGAFFEPVPVPRTGDGVFGGEAHDDWIDFGNFSLAFTRVSWRWQNRSDRAYR